MSRDIGKNNFDCMDDAIEYFKEIYTGLPPEAIKTVIEYCLKNPNKMPPDFEKIDITEPPVVKKEKEVIIEGAVEIFEHPDDPKLKVIKHKEGACILGEEEAEELQQKINKALAEQDESELKKWKKVWRERNREILKEKIKEKKNQR